MDLSLEAPAEITKVFLLPQVADRAFPAESQLVPGNSDYAKSKLTARISPFLM